MNVRELISKLNTIVDQELPVTCLSVNGGELRFAESDGFPVVTIEGGGAAPAFVALNVEES